jgi:hypothetical protein
MLSGGSVVSSISNFNIDIENLYSTSRAAREACRELWSLITRRKAESTRKIRSLLRNSYVRCYHGDPVNTKHITYLGTRPCHSSPASHRGGPGSSPGQVMWDLCGQSGTGEGFLRVLRFPLPILIPPTVLRSSSSTSRGWYNGPNGDRRTKWTQSHPTRRKY